jgi:DNA-binding HxlR family transcriptional regulator
VVARGELAGCATKRSYEDGCGAAHALDLVGERWALLVVRELLLGPKRFTDLRAGLPGISPNVLSQRLDELEHVAVVRRRRLPPPVATWVYDLTAWGHELEPIIRDLGRWGARSPYMNHQARLSADSLVLSFRTNFDPSAAGGLSAGYQLTLGEDCFRAEVRGGRLDIDRGYADDADASIEAEPTAVAAVVYDGRDLDEAIRVGDLKIEGDRAAMERFLTLFSLPEPAPAA